MRYNKFKIGINSSEQWAKYIEDKGLKFIRQLESSRIYHPSVEEILNIQEIEKIWKTGDRMWKLAHQYYQDPKLWWIIAQWNQKPTDAHFKNGDFYVIPMPLTEVLRILKV